MLQTIWWAVPQCKTEHLKSDVELDVGITPFMGPMFQGSQKKSNGICMGSWSGEIMHLVPSVRLCLSLNTLTPEPFYLRPWYLVCRSTLTLARSNLYVKVVGQRSRSNAKNRFWYNALGTVRPSVYLSLNTLTPEPFDLRPWYLVCRSTLTYNTNLAKGKVNLHIIY